MVMPFNLRACNNDITVLTHCRIKFRYLYFWASNIQYSSALNFARLLSTPILAAYTVIKTLLQPTMLLHDIFYRFTLRSKVYVDSIGEGNAIAKYLNCPGNGNGYGLSSVSTPGFWKYSSVVGITAAVTLRQVQQRTSAKVVKRLCVSQD